MNKSFDQAIEKEMEIIYQKTGSEIHKNLIVLEELVTWALPSHIIAFLSHSIQNIDKFRFQLIDWLTFKDQIFKIYDHRVGENAQEINSVTNNSHLTLDEHLVVFISHQTLLSKDFVTYQDI